MYYVPGQGYFEGEPHKYENAQGQTVIQSAGVLRNDDMTLHKAYDFAPSGIGLATDLERKSSPISGKQANDGGKLARYKDAIAKWRRGEPLTKEELDVINEYNLAVSTLPSVPRGNGSVSTADGKKKNTQKTSGYIGQTGGWKLI